MCTAISFKSGDLYFGRTLDNEFSFGEQLTVIPRNFKFDFRFSEPVTSHYAIIGMGIVKSNYPLLFDAMNEKGLCVAGLNFVGNAHYNSVDNSKCNVAVFEFIPWLLSNFSSVDEVKYALKTVNLVDAAFDDQLPVAQLHWMISDKDASIVVESVKDGLKVYDDPVGVLTNNPTFPEQVFRLNDYMHLSPKAPENYFCKELGLQVYSKGMGALGLPGDLSSTSRFVRAAFVKCNSVECSEEMMCVNQFFHILNSVNQPKGCNIADGGKYEYTVYTSCCNADKGIYYCTTYTNHRVVAVDMHRCELEGCELIRYDPSCEEEVRFFN